MLISTRWSAHFTFLNGNRELEFVDLSLLKITGLPTQKMVRKRPNTKDLGEDINPFKNMQFLNLN